MSGSVMSNEQLVARIQAGENVAENMLLLWEQNQGLIKAIAKKYTAFSEIDDLLQEGYIGLCNATYGYNPEDGTFFNYATLWIRQAIRRYIENNGSCVRIPSYMHQNMRNYNKAQEEFKQSYGRTASDSEMRRYLGLSGKEYETLIQGIRMRSCSSLDKEENYNDGSDPYRLLDVIPGECSAEETALDQVEKEELQEILWGLVDSLPIEQAKLIKERYQSDITLAQAASKLGISYEKANLAIKKGLRTLRRPEYCIQLQPYLPDSFLSMAYHGSVTTFRYTWTSSTERTAIHLIEGK